MTQIKINLIMALNLELDGWDLWGMYVSVSLVSGSFFNIHRYFWGLLKGYFSTGMSEMLSNM